MNNVIPIRAVGCKPYVEPVVYDEAKAERACARYYGLMRAWKGEPTLMDEECFQILLSDAKRSFEVAFCGAPL